MELANDFLKDCGRPSQIFCVLAAKLRSTISPRQVFEFIPVRFAIEVTLVSQIQEDPRLAVANPNSQLPRRAFVCGVIACFVFPTSESNVTNRVLVMCHKFILLIRTTRQARKIVVTLSS
jgi:hypothetical protein